MFPGTSKPYTELYGGPCNLRSLHDCRVSIIYSREIWIIRKAR